MYDTVHLFVATVESRLQSRLLRFANSKVNSVDKANNSCFVGIVGILDALESRTLQDESLYTL